MQNGDKVESKKAVYTTIKANIKNWKVPDSVKLDVLTFMSDYEIGKITGRIPTPRTLEGNVYFLKISLEFINKEVNNIVAQDIEKLSKSLLQNELKSNKFGNPNFAEATKNKIRNCLKQFLEWKIEDASKVAPLLKTLKLKTHLKQKEPEFLTEHEIDTLFKNCTSNEERYLIAVLFHGPRAAEFLNIKYSDFEMPSGKTNYVRLTLRNEFSKTQGRTINLYYKNALQAVNDYLKERLKEGCLPEERVWQLPYNETNKKLISFGTIKTRHYDKKTRKWLGDYVYIGRKILNRHLHFHLFRSSSATWLASKLDRTQICYYFGWRFKSPCPDIYCNRSQIMFQDVDDEVVATELTELKKELNEYKENAKKINEQLEIEKQARLASEETSKTVKAELMEQMEAMIEKQIRAQVEKKNTITLELQNHEHKQDDSSL